MFIFAAMLESVTCDSMKGLMKPKKAVKVFKIKVLRGIRGGAVYHHSIQSHDTHFPTGRLRLFPETGHRSSSCRSASVECSNLVTSTSALIMTTTSTGLVMKKVMINAILCALSWLYFLLKLIISTSEGHDLRLGKAPIH